jgi:hypothetical protein
MNIQEYSNRAVAVCANSKKMRLSALYFNKLVPCNPGYIPASVCYDDANLKEFTCNGWLKIFQEMGYDTFYFPSENKLSQDEINKFLALNDMKVVWPVVKIIRDRKIPAVPIFTYDDFYDIFAKGDKSTIEVKLLNTKLVDTENLDWDQILEVRKDRDSIRWLRDFRLFLYEHYSDKSPDYISDSIEQRIENHDIACKKHGLKLIDTVISSLVASKSAFGCLSLATISLLLGEPVTAITLGTTGASLPIGKVVIELSSKYIEYKHDIESPELAFIIQARKIAKRHKKKVNF